MAINQVIRAFYTLGIYGYYAVLRLAALANTKAALWVKGRKNIFLDLSKQVPKNHPIIWFHCASLGEFEQGRPLIEAIRKHHPHYYILLTFFSPSGYEIRKNYSGADAVFYLPLDTPANARQWIEKINPQLVFFIKYEFWFNYLHALKTASIPVYLVSGIFRENQHFFSWYGAWSRKQLNAFHHFFVQNNESAELLETIGIQNVTVSGDTRFDRVLGIARQSPEIKEIEIFKDNHPVLMAGSTWPDDEKILAQLPLKENGFKLIIAPHEIAPHHILSIESLFGAYKVCRFSTFTKNETATADVLIIDNIGMLSALYRYGDIAYIGGGFGKSIHNILEPATFDLPVLFGPQYHKFKEAHELLKEGGAFCIRDQSSLQELFQRFSTRMEDRRVAGKISGDYVRRNEGATATILHHIFKTSVHANTI